MLYKQAKDSVRFGGVFIFIYFSFRYFEGILNITIILLAPVG